VRIALFHQRVPEDKGAVYGQSGYDRGIRKQAKGKFKKEDHPSRISPAVPFSQALALADVVTVPWYIFWI